MRRLNGLSVLVMAACGLGFAAPAMAQSEDDWQFASDGQRQVAMASYSGGQSIIAQCAAGELKVVIVGLIPTAAPLRRLQATRSDGATDLQTWQVVEGQTLVSGLPARDARFMRVGGQMRLASPEGQAAPVTTAFDLPTQHANLDRVLTACGYPLTDDRDALTRAAPDMRLAEPPRRGSVGGQPGKSLELSCIVQSGAYRQCRVDHMLEGVRPQGARRNANSRNGVRLHPDDAASNEGRVVYIMVPLTAVTD